MAMKPFDLFGIDPAHQYQAILGFPKWLNNELSTFKTAVSWINLSID